MSLHLGLLSLTCGSEVSATSGGEVVSDGSIIIDGLATNDSDVLSSINFDSDGDVEMGGDFHSKDWLKSGNNKENIYQQFCMEDNDSQNHEINRSTDLIHISSDNVQVTSPDSGEAVDESGPISTAKATGFVTIEEALLSIIGRFNASQKRNSDWKSYLESQIAALGEELLDRKGITVPLKKRNLRVNFMLKQDPKERTEALFLENGVQDLKKTEFDHIVHIFKSRLLKELEIPGSSYSKLMSLKKELSLRQLRLEIIDKIHRELSYFVLQHIPPIELKPKTTHCAYPYCLYHTLDVMPSGAYRLLFMNAEQRCRPEHRFEEIDDEAKTPGRTRNGQMFFCLGCVEDLFNGVELMKGKIETMNGNMVERSATAESPAGLQENGIPDPPNIKPMLMAPGLNIFAAELHTFIKPEIRYTGHEFYTLNSFEYHALMKWKNMCIRKTMWELPSNRTFNLQVPGAEEDYDFVDFFGDDILDLDEPRPSIVAGVALKMEQVSVNDISTLTSQEPPKKATVESDSKNCKETRVLHPLSEIMLFVDHRVQKAWAAMDPPYVPRVSKRAADLPYRKWPAPSFWPAQLEKWGELERATKRNREMMEEPTEVIFPSGSEDGTGETGAYSGRSPVVTPKHQVNRRGRPGLCVTCGSIASPEWRNGPRGSNTLCNACGIRYTRGRGRRLVPPPK